MYFSQYLQLQTINLLVQRICLLLLVRQPQFIFVLHLWREFCCLHSQTVTWQNFAPCHSLYLLLLVFTMKDGSQVSFVSSLNIQLHEAQMLEQQNQQWNYSISASCLCQPCDSTRHRDISSVCECRYRNQMVLVFLLVISSAFPV